MFDPLSAYHDQGTHRLPQGREVAVGGTSDPLHYPQVAAAERDVTVIVAIAVHAMLDPGRSYPLLVRIHLRSSHDLRGRSQASHAGCPSRQDLQPLRHRQESLGPPNNQSY